MPPDQTAIPAAQAAAMLRAVLASTFDGILVTDPQGRLLAYNQKFVDLWNVPEDVLAKLDDEKAVAAVRDQLLEPERFSYKIRELYENPGMESFDVLRFKDGRVFERYSRPHSRDGAMEARVWSFRDVTSRIKLQTEIDKRSRVEAELRDAYELVNAIVENLPDMVFLKDAQELRFIRFNKAGEELLGFSREEMIGKNDYDFFPKNEADFFTSKDRQVLTSGEVQDIPEETIQTSIKGERVLHTKKVPIYGDNGRPLYLLGISEDITEKKATQVRLLQEQSARQESQKAVDLRNDFISIAAHELRNPLSALKMELQVLRKVESGDRLAATFSREELLRKAEDQVDRMNRRVHLLLDVSRIRADRLVLDLQQTDVCRLLQQGAERLADEAKQAHVTFELQLTKCPTGRWDPGRIEQVIENLLSNAIKYGSGNPVEITTWANAGSVFFSVKDHGVGITKEDQPRIFDRFERTLASRSFEGIGLGLWITQQIVSAHGGAIGVESEPGKGATFIVELPLSAEAPAQ